MRTRNQLPPGFEAPSTASLYEVRCQHCKTSFPAGTRRCIHCGERIGRPVSHEMGMPGPFEGEAEGEAPEAGGSAVRAALWALTAVIAMAGSLFRVCQGGGP